MRDWEIEDEIYRIDLVLGWKDECVVYMSFGAIFINQIIYRAPRSC